MVSTKAVTPHVPITADEIIEQVHEAHAIGITIAHIHARHVFQNLPPDGLWSLGGIGHAQLRANALAIVEGGVARGFSHRQRTGASA